MRGKSQSGSPVRLPIAAPKSLVDTFADTHHFVPFVVVPDKLQLRWCSQWHQYTLCPTPCVGNTVDPKSMKLFGARENAMSTDLALKNAARTILRDRLNLLIEV